MRYTVSPRTQKTRFDFETTCHVATAQEKMVCKFNTCSHDEESRRLTKD